MKKVLNIALATLTFAFIGTIDAKIMKRRAGTAIPVTKNEKQIFVDTKALKNAPTPAEKMAASQKLAADLQRDPYAQLKIQEAMIKKMIKEKEENIWNLDDKKLVQEAILKKEDLEEQLAEVQKKLGRYNNIQPEEVSKLKTWAIYTLITTASLATAYLLVTKREALGSVVSTIWGHVPSLRDTTTTAVGAVGSFTASLVVNELKEIALQKTYDTLMSYISDPNADPEMREEYDKEAEKKLRQNLMRFKLKSKKKRNYKNK